MIEDLIAYREQRGGRFARLSTASIPTKFGLFRAVIYHDRALDVEHIAFVNGNVSDSCGLPVRVHSECLTGDVFRSQRCDCGDQLEQAMTIIQTAGVGCVVYLRGQEGRGIGLSNKMAAYALQDSSGIDTFEANLALGFAEDARDYTAAAFILHDLGIKSVTLLTSNPDKVSALQTHNVKVDRCRALLVSVNESNAKYLSAKEKRFQSLRLNEAK